MKTMTYSLPFCSIFDTRDCGVFCAFPKYATLKQSGETMPLLFGGKKNIGKNISRELKKHRNMSRSQAIAIALSQSKKRKPRKK
jgi:hypothetical protein